MTVLPTIYALTYFPDHKVLREFLERNPPANINTANFSEKALLHEAAREGNPASVELCLKYGTNPKKRNEIGETMLAAATKE